MKLTVSILVLLVAAVYAGPHGAGYQEGHHQQATHHQTSYHAPPDSKKTAPVRVRYQDKHEETEVEVAPIPYCADGHKADKSGCLTIHHGEMDWECPDKHWDLRDDGKVKMCVRSKDVDSHHQCPKGTIDDGKKGCKKRVTRPVHYECPKGYELTSKGMCVKKGKHHKGRDHREEPHWDCPKGWRQEGHYCFHENEAEAVIQCPKGAERHHGGKKGHGDCVMKHVVSPQCKHGKYVDGLCMEEDEVEPDYDCPKGFEYNKGMCHGEEDVDAQEACPKGYSMESGKKGHKHSCVARTLVVPVAKAGKKESHVEAPADCKGPKCAPAPRKHKQPHFECDGKGMELDAHGACYQRHEVDAEEVCPHGSRQSGKKHGCVRVVVVKPTLDCGKKGGHYRYVSSGKGKHGGMCVSSKHHGPECPKGYEEAGKGTCLKFEDVEGIEVCPKGYTAESGKKGKKQRCVSHDKRPATPKCKKGHFDGQWCVDKAEHKEAQHEFARPEAECEKGWELESGKQGHVCVSYEHVDVEDFCPKGTRRSGHKGKKGGCEIEEQVPPRGKCQKDFVLGKDNKCTKQEWHKPDYRCPAGAVEKKKKCYMPTKSKSVVYQPPHKQQAPADRKKYLRQ